MEKQEEEKTTNRVNLRLTDGQYELMKNLGGALGIELDSQCAKHFFLIGMQSSMGALSGNANTKSVEFMTELLRMFKAAEASQEEEKNAA